jgi:hypothetical protein
MNRTFTMSALKALRALGIAVLIFGCSALNANNSHPKFRVTTLKAFANRKAVATPSELRRNLLRSFEPRVSKQTLG